MDLFNSFNKSRSQSGNYPYSSDCIRYKSH